MKSFDILPKKFVRLLPHLDQWGHSFTTFPISAETCVKLFFKFLSGADGVGRKGDHPLSIDFLKGKDKKVTLSSTIITIKVH